ncbi:MAG TPA: ribose 5-phosphate isomerase B [Campylobacterales bacterium]|nr:ribose 5-phosphate isomerase B [Campylobacterales bacterium]HIO71018.1 ribose 5-phosphate isomerase B [Campylobacterales bacterium]
MKYFIATDHAGVEIKNYTKELLEKMGHEVEDLGPFNTERVDYPDFAEKLAREVAKFSEKISEEEDWKNSGVFGILICGTGIGMSITANKIPNIRAGLCHDAYTAEMARAHNNANVLCFGARVVGKGTIESIVKAWDSAKFEGGRHLNRVQKIGKLDR